MKFGKILENVLFAKFFNMCYYINVVFQLVHSRDATKEIESLKLE